MSKLEAAYKAVQVPYPPDTLSGAIDEQAKKAKADAKLFEEISKEKVKQAEELLQKYKVMIPYDEMLLEDFALTFPDWVSSRADPSCYPNYERSPGISKEEKAQYAKPDGPPFSIPWMGC